mmetsp:Transcript_52382/g.167999  ORF Transcript_52382/g.167999 Transcript_52382/m.167999 type:complete len:291 (-) Transcript_52382:14-886(-)
MGTSAGSARNKDEAATVLGAKWLSCQRSRQRPRMWLVTIVSGLLHAVAPLKGQATLRSNATAAATAGRCRRRSSHARCKARPARRSRRCLRTDGPQDLGGVEALAGGGATLAGRLRLGPAAQVPEEDAEVGVGVAPPLRLQAREPHGPAEGVLCSSEVALEVVSHAQVLARGTLSVGVACLLAEAEAAVAELRGLQEAVLRGEEVAEVRQCARESRRSCRGAFRQSGRSAEAGLRFPGGPVARPRALLGERRRQVTQRLLLPCNLLEGPCRGPEPHRGLCEALASEELVP